MTTAYMSTLPMYIDKGGNQRMEKVVVFGTGGVNAERDGGNILPQESRRIQAGTGNVGKITGPDDAVDVFLIGIIDEFPEIGEILRCGSTDLVPAPHAIHVE